MTYQLSITRKPTYLHAVVTGRNTPENVAGYLAELLRQCEVHTCFQVLVEERLDGPRLPVIDVYDLASQGSFNSEGRFKAFAFVDVHAEGDLMQFAETVAVNRGVQLAVHPTVAEAETWLQNQPGQAGPAGA